MSLILEALKKLEREKDVPQRGFLVMAPVEWRSSPRRLGLVLGFLAVGMGVAAVGAFRWRGGVPPRRTPGTTAESSSVPSATHGPVATASAAPEPPPVAANASAAPPPAVAPESPSERQAATATTPSGGPLVPATRAAKPAAQPDSPAGPSGDAGAQAPRSANRGQEKDRLQLQAISQRDGEPVAVINERLVREGDSFDGVRILKIGADQVEIEVRGLRRVLRF